jgi:pimeloyl-ACP methyl ester carboxylesterase
LRNLLRPSAPLPPAAPVPPPLPPGRVVAVAGQGETFVRVSGPKEGRTPVLLLHGWAATADLNWWRTYQLLSQERQLIAPDHPGHGRGLRTEARFTLERCADLAAGVLDALEISKAVVVGYSMGGPIALRLWERHPERVAALVLGATALRFDERWYDRATWRVVAVFEWLLRVTGDRWFVRRIVREVIEQDASMEAWRGWLFGELQRGNPRDLHDAGVALSRFDGSGLVCGIDIPRAVIVTEQDQLVPPHRQQLMAEALAAPKYSIPADHSVPLVRSSVFVDALRTALDAVERELSDPPVREPT